MSRNPYKPPNSPAIDLFTKKSRRYFHSLLALLSGFILPLILLLAIRLIFGGPTSMGNVTLWAPVAIGSLLTAVGVYPFKEMRLWLAAALGMSGSFASLVLLFAWGVISGAI
jgi:hypothetical protein